jgi:hypothetical protein
MAADLSRYSAQATGKNAVFLPSIITKDEVQAH